MPKLVNLSTNYQQGYFATKDPCCGHCRGDVAQEMWTLLTSIAGLKKTRGHHMKWKIIMFEVICFNKTHTHIHVNKSNTFIHMSNGLNLVHFRKDVAEMVIVFFYVSLIVPEDLTCVIKSVKHVYQKSLFFVTPIVPESFMIVSSINVLV